MYTKTRLAAGVLALSLVAVACGDDEETASTDATSGDSTEEASEASESGGTESASGDAVCPANLVIQTDWWPEAEHGGTYQLIGPDGDADAENFTYSGPIQEQYAGETGIETVEVRAGGDAISFNSVQSEMYTDDDIYLGYVNTDDAISSSGEQAVVGVATTLEINPQILMFDPAQNDIQDFADIGATDLPVLHFEGVTYMDYLIAQGDIEESQSDPSYGGAPDRWLAASGNIIQQGFVSNEVYKYENDIEGWQKDVDYLLIHDSGYQPYPAMMSVRADRLEEETPCLEALVPMLQQAWVDYVADPEALNTKLIEVNETYDTYWTLSPELNAQAVELFESEELASNGPDATYGNFDTERVQGLIDILDPIFAEQNIEVAEGLSPETVVTNEFIDDSIGLP